MNAIVNKTNNTERIARLERIIIDMTFTDGKREKFTVLYFEYLDKFIRFQTDSKTWRHIKIDNIYGFAATEVYEG